MCNLKMRHLKDAGVKMAHFAAAGYVFAECGVPLRTFVVFHSNQPQRTQRYTKEKPWGSRSPRFFTTKVHKGTQRKTMGITFSKVFSQQSTEDTKVHKGKPWGSRSPRFFTAINHRGHKGTQRKNHGDHVLQGTPLPPIFSGSTIIRIHSIRRNS